MRLIVFLSELLLAEKVNGFYFDISHLAQHFVLHIPVVRIIYGNEIRSHYNVFNKSPWNHSIRKITWYRYAIVANNKKAS